MGLEKARFGRYVLISKLGMGGMAEVFKAQLHGNSDLIVAIKRILPQFSQDKNLITMLVNEARLSMSLNHPNIVPVLDFGMVEGDYFMAMEYIRGKDLKSIMIRCKTKRIDLPFQMSVYIMSKVLRALDFAHVKRDNFDQPLDIVHRDISPHNILISFRGETKILDFGIAKATSLAGTTQTGILKGKFSYMSPEQSYGEDVDLRTDLFSAGIVLWELLTLESYYQAETDIKLLSAVREAKLRNPSDVNSKVPKALAEIVMKALQKKPKKRYQSGEEFAVALENYQREMFGAVTDADLGTFIGSMFGISAEEVILNQKTGQELADMVNPAEERTPPDSRIAPTQRPRLRNSSWERVRIPSWSWKLPLLALALGGASWLMLRYSPTGVWREWNNGLDRIAEAVHRNQRLSDQKPTIEIDPPLFQTPSRTLYYAPGVREAMQDLPFEPFDQIRNQIEDLALVPRPAGAQPIPNRPEFWTVEQSGYRIVYSVADQQKTLTISSIEKIRQRTR